LSNSDFTNGKKYDSVALYRIRKLLSDLSNKTGRGTELVSLYVPPKKPIHEVISALREESGTASNIKSDTTRQHVQDALTKTMQRLRLYKQTPENGLVIFCGAIPGPGGPGNETIELYEVLPNKPVTTYLYRCIAPETKILLQNGMHKTVEELRGSWNEERVKSTRENCSKIVSSRIKQYLETFAGERKVFQLTSESGRSIVATEDHPFFTPRGWKTIGDLKIGDFVCVFPSDDFETGVTTPCSYTAEDEILVDEQTIRQLPDAPANIQLTVRKLKEKNLLPLGWDNPKLPIIARIIGHLFTDLSFTHNMEMRKGCRPYSHSTMDLCLGDETAEQEITADLSSLGLDVQKAYRSVHEIHVDSRSHESKTIRIKLKDTAFCTLLRVLGAPVGSRVRQETTIPSWLFRSPLQVQREFLASYMGGDGEAPRIVKSNRAGALRITFQRVEGLRESGSEFAEGLVKLFGNFGIKINHLGVKDGYVRRDGSKTLEFELRFKSSEENVIKICHAVGYRYCQRKAQAGLLVGEYLRIKAQLRSTISDKLSLVREMYSSNQKISRIAAALSPTETTARVWANGKVMTPVIRSTLVPAFSNWLSRSRVNSSELLLWESIISKESVNVQDVRDLTLDNEDHSFFANGFLVHNCDDHFHLDPLREMLREENVVGILALDATEAGLGIVSGDNWEVIDVTSSGVSGKTRKGGQSARRYERLREMELTDYYNRLADHAKKAFIESNHVKGLIVSGPGPTKDAFVKDGYLDYRLQNLIVGTLDTGYAGREGVRETIEKSGKLLENVRVVEERKLVQKFLREVNSDSGLAIYGVNDILSALKRAAVDRILVNDDSGMINLKATCQKCGNIREKFIQRSNIVQEKQNLLSSPCPNCGSLEMEVKETDIVDYLVDASIDSGANVEVISSKTEDGAMLKSFGGIAALLRYRV
jgi:peptide chain release factor 1